MAEDLDLKQIERKTYMAYHQDGLWDLLIGLAMMSVILDVILGESGIYIVVIAGAAGLVPMLKKVVTLPRLGYVKFSPKRQSREKLNIILLTVLLTMTALLGAVMMSAYSGDAGWQRWIRDLRLIPFGIVLTSVAAALGLLWGIWRCWIYALLSLAVFVIGHIFEWRMTIHFAILGSVLFLVGLVMLITFINKYPKKAPEAGNDI
ncbi:MAG: hypothetical protein JSV52_14385 [Candidatus Zixiibacteriota bacterium]|nr:MAG: hypothetical protein JSV52_14385 [candidate division Zixibacteria bacterium]